MKSEYPWHGLVLTGWTIVGMNHYRSGDALHLFVAMTKDGRCIQAEGLDNTLLWDRLEEAAT